MELPEVGIRQWGGDEHGYSAKSDMQSPFLSLERTKEFHPPLQSPNPSLIIDDGHPDSRLAPMHLLNRKYLAR
jgi:GntR family transcriptional regulator/MocR family aminotransferase